MKQFFSTGPFLHFIAISFGIICQLQTSNALAVPNCQVLDKAASKLDITLDLFGDVKKTKVDKIKAYLWIDPKFPEDAQLVASLEPRISQLFGKFEENPMLIGMLANMLDKELIFRSLSVEKREGKADQYKVRGQVSSGEKTYPADFSVSLSQVGDSQSRFAAKVQSKNFEKIIGTPGSAQGDLDLVFRTKPGISKELCAL